MTIGLKNIKGITMKIVSVLFLMMFASASAFADQAATAVAPQDAGTASTKTDSKAKKAKKHHHKKKSATTPSGT